MSTFNNDIKFGLIFMAVFIVIIVILIGGFIYAGVGRYDNAAMGQVQSISHYDCDGITGCWVFTISTPTGNIQQTFLCTYYNNMTSLPLRSSVGGWWTLGHSVTYDINPMDIVKGC
jgi:hypothetical protein